MINTINEAINRKLNSISFTTIIKGTVESLEPLKVRISNKISIGLSFIEPRSLGIDDSSPSPALPLVVGEEIEMVRYNNGQRFYVLGKAASGGTVNYNDLQNKPILNTNNTASQSVKSDEVMGGTIKLHKISKTGSYNDLRDKPTKVSEFTNDAGYLTEHQDISNLATKDELHFHNNKSVLDSITQENIDNWNNSTGEVLPIGSMIPFGSDTNIPSNWKICDGSAISRETYADLFNVIGTSYGEGDGSTTFNLPDKRGRNSVGLDTNQTEFDTIGKKGGEKTHQLTIEEMPSHDHRLTPFVDIRQGDGQTNAHSGSLGTHLGGYVSKPNALVSPTGGNQPHNNLQPYEVDVWIIKVSNLVSSLESKNANVIDNLTSTSTTDALSANMGKELNEKLTNILKPKLLGAGAYTTSGTLNDNITNYNYIIFEGWLSNSECATGIINIETFELNKAYYANLTLDAYSRRIGVKFTSNTSFTVIRDNGDLTIKNIYGIGKRN